MRKDPQIGKKEVQSLKNRNSQILPPVVSNVDSGQILSYQSDFHFLMFSLFYKIRKFNTFILWLMDRAATVVRIENFSELMMLITLLALMSHPLFEWKLRTKIPALSDNFALIIEVNMLDL